MHHLQRIHALHHHLYRCIPTSPTSSNLSNLTSLTRLTTSSSSSTIYIDNDTYISYRWSTSRELLQNLKNVVYTGVDLQVIHFYLNSYKSPACKVICTEIVAQELLHRSSANFQWSNCMWTPAKSDFSSSSISLWRQRQPGGGLRNVTLCGVSDTQTCGEMRVLFVLGPAATVCGDRDRAGRTSKHVAKCKFGRARRSPFARNEGQPSKTGVFWKFRCKRGMKAKRQ